MDTSVECVLPLRVTDMTRSRVGGFGHGGSIVITVEVSNQMIVFIMKESAAAIKRTTTALQQRLPAYRVVAVVAGVRGSQIP